MRSVLLIATVILSGCALPSAYGSRAVPLAPATVRPATPSAYLYVAGEGGTLNYGGVTVYDSGLRRAVRSITRGIFNPMSIAVGADATLYVLDQSSGYAGGIRVTEYDAESRKPSRRIDKLYWGVALATDASNNLYVANCNSCVDEGAPPRNKVADSVTVYGPKQTKPTRTIVRGIHTPQSLAVDPRGYVYVANGGTPRARPSITVYAPGSTALLREVKLSIHRDLKYMTLDSQGNLYVTNRDEVIEFGPGLQPVLRRIRDEVESPRALAVDTSGNLYVANDAGFPATYGISVYPPGATRAKYRIKRDVNDPVALAIDGDGRLYVANDGGTGNGDLDVFKPGARRPARLLAGNQYGDPIALAFGAQ
jgi:sugar lactone lactonase YvrE